MTRGAWYASGGGILRDLWTLLHPPYTSMVLAYVTLGAVLSESFEPKRWVALLVAYFLGLGCAAHFLDEARGHPWGTGFRRRTLVILAVVTILPAVGIGGYCAWTLYTGFLVFVVVETFFALAYNLEWFGGRFHTDVWFAVSWAALPFLASLYLQDGRLPLWSIAVAGALASTAIVQISLSRWVKGYRRGPALVALSHAQGTQPISTQEMIDRPQRSLKFIVWSVDLLAIGLLLRRLLPVLLLFGLLTPTATPAQDRPTVTVKKVGAEYRVRGTVQVPTEDEALWDALTDYDRLSSFVEPLTTSRTLEVNDDGSRLVEQVSLVKVLLVKRESRVALLMKEFPRSRIVSALVEGDFITYHAEWKLEPEATKKGRCILSLDMKVRPKLTGPGWIEKRILKSGVEKTLTGVRDEAVRRARGWTDK